MEYSDTHTVSGYESGSNPRISAEEVAFARARAPWELVSALLSISPVNGSMPAALVYARKLASINGPVNRAAEAKRLARLYVPRGPEPHSHMTKLLERAAAVYEAERAADPTLSLERLRGRVSTMILAHAAFAYFPAGVVQRQRRRWPDGDRIHTAAVMVARRGAGRCLNVDCKQRARKGCDYCASCDGDGNDKRRRRAIEDLWSAITRP